MPEFDEAGAHATPALPASTYLLAFAQAINLTCAVLTVTIAALVGTQLASNPALATVPYGMQFGSVMLCTLPASMLMRRWGRRAVFLGGALVLMISGVVGYQAVVHGSFTGLIVAHALLGAYIACANFHRFAAVDGLPVQLKARGMSLVVAGGVLAAVLGPFVASSLRSVAGFPSFALCYAALSILGLAALLLMLAWRETPATESAPAPANQPGSETTTTAHGLLIALAISAAAGAYFLMNLLMVQASLVLKDICSFSAASHAIQAHVLAMFGPSFFTGRLIERFGVRRILETGLVLVTAAGLTALAPLRYEAVLAGLVLLGLGWNLLYVAAGALLAQCVTHVHRHRWQGLNDTAIAACATLGALLPAPALALMGWRGTNLLAVPFCVLGFVLCGLAFSAGCSGGVRTHAA